jgi:predicted nuclease with TOPRIM domain
MLRFATIYEFTTILVSTLANVAFEAFFVIGLVYFVNMKTDVYKNIADLTSEFSDFRKILWKNCYDGPDKEKIDNKIKHLESEIETLKQKISKVKKLNLAVNEVVEKLSERILDIEDELDENYEEGGDSNSDDGSSSDKETKETKKKNKNNKN